MSADFAELDEAVELLQSLIKKQERGSLSVNYGQQIGMSVLYQSHRVLDLLVGMGFEITYIRVPGSSKLNQWTELAIPHPTGRRQFPAAPQKDTFPAAVLAAVTSEEFQAWKKEQRCLFGR